VVDVRTTDRSARQTRRGSSSRSFGFAAGVTIVAGFVIWQSRLLGAKSRLGLSLIAVGAVAVKEGVSRTGFVAVIVAVGVTLLIRSRNVSVGGRRALALTVLSLLFILVLPSQQAGVARWFTGGDTQVGTLTNRTLIWETFVPQALHHPLVGLGPGALRFDDNLRVEGANSLLGQAHNSLVEAFVAGGVMASRCGSR
jgi:O-antigen ligase